MIRPLFFAPLLGMVLLATRADELTWKVATGTTLVRSFERDSQLALESVSIRIDGQDQDGAAKPEIMMAQTFSAELSDRIEQVEDARATKFVRTFTSLSSTRAQTLTPPEGEPREQKLELSSELEGKSVVFEHGGDGWSKTWAKDQEGDDALLEGLRAELDFHAFLPGKSVSTDDSWDLEAEAFLNLLRPGGRLSLKSEDEEASANNARETQLDQSLEGTGKATYKGVREEDGIRLGVIAIRCELRMSSSEEGDAGKAGTIATKVELSYELEGELLWDIAAGVARRASLSGDIEVVQTQERRIETPDGEHTLEQVLIFAGKSNYKAAIEPKS